MGYLVMGRSFTPTTWTSPWYRAPWTEGGKLPLRVNAVQCQEECWARQRWLHLSAHSLPPLHILYYHLRGGALTAPISPASFHLGPAYTRSPWSMLARFPGHLPTPHRLAQLHQGPRRYFGFLSPSLCPLSCSNCFS